MCFDDFDPLLKFALSAQSIRVQEQILDVKLLVGNGLRYSSVFEEQWGNADAYLASSAGLECAAIGDPSLLQKLRTIQERGYFSNEKNLQFAAIIPNRASKTCLIACSTHNKLRLAVAKPIDIDAFKLAWQAETQSGKISTL